MSSVTKLDESATDEARRLVASAIPHVNLARIGRPDNEPRMVCRDFIETMNRRWGTTETLPEDLWLGIMGEDGQLAAALHAAPLISAARQNIDALYSGSKDAGSPSWIAQLLREVLMVDEIAVLPEQRRRGYAAALLVEFHRLARLRGVRNVQAHAGSLAAQNLFRSAGYIVAPPRTPVPKQYQCDLITVWHHAYDKLGGSYVYNHVDRVT